MKGGAAVTQRNLPWLMPDSKDVDFIFIWQTLRLEDIFSCGVAKLLLMLQHIKGLVYRC